ncbi:MAG TPA: OsmC family protein [Bryobacteraceae bacterium]|nr:OsmC family protein [Bryobacteraceae bacterium]HXJ37812.1 OsmC family protein [Bryobacteraceae bacterium]
MRHIDASNSRLISEAVGEIELEENVLVIRRIHVRLKLKAAESDWETATRVHGIFADKCPVYRSLKAAITMTTELILDKPASVPEIARA